MERRLAIILHGPPGVGKTEVAKLLIQHWGSADVCLISLDQGWAGSNPFRITPSLRYSDLLNASEKRLIIELGCGEPPDLHCHGATRAAHEWMDVLNQTGRDVFAFLLWYEWPEAVERLTKRYSGNPDALFRFWEHIGLYALYERKHALAAFSPTCDINEVTISTTGRTALDVALEIVRTSC